MATMQKQRAKLLPHTMLMYVCARGHSHISLELCVLTTSDLAPPHNHHNHHYQDIDSIEVDFAEVRARGLHTMCHLCPLTHMHSPVAFSGSATADTNPKAAAATDEDTRQGEKVPGVGLG